MSASMALPPPTAPPSDRLAAAEAPPDGEGAPLEWTFNPWRERPGAAAVAVVGALGMCLAVARLGGSPVLVLALCLAVVGALAPLIAPARCRLDREGVARRGPLGWSRRRWIETGRCSLGSGGLLVSPYARPHWLDATRGLFLPVPRLAREDLLTRIRPRLPRHGL